MTRQLIVASAFLAALAAGALATLWWGMRGIG